MPSEAVSVTQTLSTRPSSFSYGVKDSNKLVSWRLRFLTSPVGTFFIRAAGVPANSQHFLLSLQRKPIVSTCTFRPMISKFHLALTMQPKATLFLHTDLVGGKTVICAVLGTCIPALMQWFLQNPPLSLLHHWELTSQLTNWHNNFEDLWSKHCILLRSLHTHQRNRAITSHVWNTHRCSQRSTWKATDYVSGKVQAWNKACQGVSHLLEFCYCVFSFHSLQPWVIQKRETFIKISSVRVSTLFISRLFFSGKIKERRVAQTNQGLPLPQWKEKRKVP
jgi:hypothetical protein